MSNSQTGATLSDDDLLIALKWDGEARREAVTELYRRYAHRFSAYLIRRGTPQHEAEELVQEAFIRLIRQAESFTAQGRGNAWIWRVARSAWLDVWKKKAPDKDALDIDEVGEQVLGVSPDVAAQSDFQDCVHGQLSRFVQAYPEGGQAVLWAAVDGFTTQQIAELLDRTAGAVREFLSQTRKRLREYLQPCLDD